MEVSESHKALPDTPSSSETVQNTAEYIRVLERMAVPSASLEDVKFALIEEFRKNTLHYLSNPDFALKMICKNAPAKSSVKRKYSESPG
jgi:hypothetical protein